MDKTQTAVVAVVVVVSALTCWRFKEAGVRRRLTTYYYFTIYRIQGIHAMIQRNYSSRDYVRQYELRLLYY